MSATNEPVPQETPDGTLDGAAPGATARRAGYATALGVAAAGSLVLEIVGGRMLAP